VWGEQSDKCKQPEGYARWTMKLGDNGHKPKRIASPWDFIGTPNNHPNTLSTDVAETGQASGLQQIGGCEWGFASCAVVADKSQAGDALAFAVLDISLNDSPGEIPASIGDIPFLRILDIGGNAFSGELPEELGNLIYLDSLVIANNNFSGELPQSLVGLTNLTYFDFGASGAEPPTDPAFQDWLGSVPNVISTAVEADQIPIDQFGLSAVYPNPFRGQATFTLSIETTQRVRIGLYNVLGQRVRLVVDAVLSPNQAHEVRVDGGGLPAGLYVISVEGETFGASSRAVLVR